MPIPSPRKRPFYVKETWPAVVALVLGAAAGLASLLVEWFAHDRNALKIAAAAVALLAVIVLGGLKLAQSRYQDVRDDKKESPEDLRACLHVIHRSVAERKHEQEPKEGWLRATVYRLEGDSLEQSVNYVGGDEENAARGAGRRYSVKYGLIGKVARAGDVRSFDRKKDMPFEQWVTYLVDETGMDREEAKRTREDRFAFLGVPIKGPSDAVRAVVYLDAGEPGFFDEGTTGLILGGCLGLAKWVDERYYRS